MSHSTAAAVTTARLTHGDKLQKIGELNPERLRALEVLADLVLREELAAADLKLRISLRLVKPPETARN